MTAPEASPRFLTTYKRYLRLLFERFKTRGLIAGAFAALAFGASIIWVGVDYDKPDPWVNLFSLLSVVFAALAAILASTQSRIEGDYSLCFALAHGYVNNFVRHALADLTEQSPDDGQFVIFRPAGLEELDDLSVERYKNALTAKGYTPSVRVLKPVGKRARDVFMIQEKKLTGKKVSYVDFPSTLLTLSSLIEYRNDVQRADTGHDLSTVEKQLMTQALIDCFFREVARMLAPEITKSQVIFTNSRMGHL